MDQKPKHGCQFTLSEEMFSDIINKAMGLPTGTLDVRYVTNEHWNRAVCISAVTDDERFPVLVEGTQYPLISPIVKTVKLDDGRYELRFDGFTTI